MLEQFPGYETRDLDVVRNTLFARFGARSFDSTPGHEKVLIKANWAETKNLQVITSFCSASTDTSYEGLSVVRQYFEIGRQGRLAFEVGSKATNLSTSHPSMVIPSSVSFRVKAHPRHHFISLRVENDALKRLLRALLDDDVDHEITFNEQLGKHGPWYQNLRESVIQFMADLDLMGPAGGSVAREAFARSLMIKFLFCNSSAFSEKLHAKTLAPSLTQLRRIEDFIETNWHRPVDIEELAGIFNISTRSIFRHFKMYRGVSPLDYIKTVRLNRARKLLETNHENRGVVAIATQCGFQSLGHFSRDYREAFFELPSETLRRARTSARR